MLLPLDASLLLLGCFLMVGGAGESALETFLVPVLGLSVS
jgi:hypothetical protein